MRLTLRTLLAWLDDTLPPSEVRQIGQQVAETPLAQELVEKIQRVTRQRRLTVPPNSGHDAVDANVVADYLGDSLSPELVTEYEKKCLTSDLHLAEVASAHQILSLLAQKAKVPPEAKNRMYHLVRGRETVGTAPPPRPVTPAPASGHRAVPETRAVLSSYDPPPAPRRSVLERFGPLAAVASLILILGWSAWMSMGPSAATDLAAAPIRPIKDKPTPPAPRLDDKPAVAPEKAVEKEDPADPAVDKARPDPAVDKDKTKPDAKPEAKAADLPPGAAGVVGPGDGVLLRYNADARSWDRLVAGAALRDGDRLVNLPPFRAPVRLGSADVTIVGDGEITVLAPGAGASSRFHLNRGKVRIVGSPAVDPIVVPFEGAYVKITAPAGSVAGLERVTARVPGDKLPSAPGLRILSSEGTVTAESGALSEVLSAGSSTLFHAPKSFAARAEAPSHAWLADATPGASEQDRAARLARYFQKADRSALVCLLEANEDERDEVRRDVVTAVGAIGSLELTIPTLSRPNDPRLPQGRHRRAPRRGPPRRRLRQGPALRPGSRRGLQGPRRHRRGPARGLLLPRRRRRVRPDEAREPPEARGRRRPRARPGHPQGHLPAPPRRLPRLRPRQAHRRRRRAGLDRPRPTPRAPHPPRGQGEVIRSDAGHVSRPHPGPPSRTIIFLTKMTLASPSA